MKKTKRFMCIFLVVAMIIGGLPIRLQAVDPVSYETAWDEYLSEADVMPDEWDAYSPYDDHLYYWLRTLEAPLGAVGFEYGFDSDPSAATKISIQFTTPPVAGLLLMLEARHPYTRELYAPLESHALAAHENFYAQLTQLGEYKHDELGRLEADWFEIVSAYYDEFNGVTLWVPAGMVEVIAALPGIFAVTPYEDVVYVYEAIYEVVYEEDVVADDERDIIDDVDDEDFTSRDDETIYSEDNFQGDDLDIMQKPETPIYADILQMAERLQESNEIVTLTLHGNGGLPAVQTLTRTAGSQMGTLPQPQAREGYVFIGWINSPAVIGGEWLTANSTIDSGNTVFWARWASIVTVEYMILVNVDTDEARAHAVDSVNEFKDLFLENFGIYMVIHPDSPRYEPALNGAHLTCGWGGMCWRAWGRNVLDVYPSNATTAVFKFVDYFLCARCTPIAGMARQPWTRGGWEPITWHMGEMVVTTAGIEPPITHSRAVIHEISHVFGAPDCNSAVCTMNPRIHHILDNWCIPCRDDIHTTITRHWRGITVTPWHTVTLSQSTVYINNENLSTTVDVGGTAQGTVTLDTSVLPPWITATATDEVITVTGTRPPFGSAGTGSFNVTARRQSASATFTINVDLTPLPPTFQTINFSAGANTGMVATVNGTLITSGDEVIEGSTVVFTATPNAGFEVSGWMISDGTLSGDSTDITRSVVVGQTDIRVSLFVMPTVSVDVSSWEELRIAVNAVTEGVPTAILINNSFAAPGGVPGNAIVIPANRHITLVSSNTVEGAANVRALTQANRDQRHFTLSANSSLTLGQNITLNGGQVSSGGVLVNAGGELNMNPGSIIENCLGLTAVVLNGSGTEEATRARFTMLGGSINNNTGFNVGGVSVGTNSIFIMQGDSSISSNNPLTTLYTQAIAGGVLLLTDTSIFEMRDNASIHSNRCSNSPHTFRVGDPGNAGGVLVLNGAFTMYGGSINHNITTTRHAGGGVRITNGTFTMHDGYIAHNRIGGGNNSGGVSLGESFNPKFTMYGGNIYRNVGLGVSARGGTMTMYNGSINNNSGGVGVLVVGVGTTFTMSDGSINYNHTTGVAVEGTGTTFMMSNGSISNNTGTGVRMSGFGTSFIMTGGSISGSNYGVDLLGNAQIGNTPTFTMSGGSINHNWFGGVHLTTGVFTMEGGTISNHSRNMPSMFPNIGGAVHITGGVFNMTSDNARIENNQFIATGIGSGGGGIFQSGGTVNISAGVITGNTATRGGGVYVSAAAVGAFNMTGGSITNNHATDGGGGIYSTRANNSPILPDWAYDNLNIGPAAVFSGNTAGNGASTPPDITPPNIASRQASIWGNPLNNYDINFTGRLGQELNISNWAENYEQQ